MERWVTSEKKLMFNYELLRASMAVKDLYLQNAAKEIYENIGQVLSLVRMQLSAHKVLSPTASEKAGNLIAKSIQDLRQMGKLFYPHDELFTNDFSLECFCNTLDLICPVLHSSPKRSNHFKNVQPELRLFLLKMLQDIISALKLISDGLIEISFSASLNAVSFIITYSGKKLELHNKSLWKNGLSLKKRAELIRATLKLSTDKTGNNLINLTSPYTVAYE